MNLKLVKYPRTLHLPYSPGLSSDDKVLKDTSSFQGKNVVVTLKMDGENTTLYNNYLHARSLNNKHHWSKSWVKDYHSKIKDKIPENMRIVVENLYATHSIKYNNLKSYVYGISIWENETCFSWDDTLKWFKLFDIVPVPEIYRGIYDEKAIQNSFLPYVPLHEGYVVRLEKEFYFDEFSFSVAKYVRKNHVSVNDEHWFYRSDGEKNSLEIV